MSVRGKQRVSETDCKNVQDRDQHSIYSLSIQFLKCYAKVLIFMHCDWPMS